MFANSEYLPSMQMHVEAREKMPLLRIELTEPRMFPGYGGLELLCLVRDLLEPSARVREVIQRRGVGGAAWFYSFGGCDVLGTHAKNQILDDSRHFSVHNTQMIDGHVDGPKPTTIL